MASFLPSLFVTCILATLSQGNLSNTSRILRRRPAGQWTARHVVFLDVNNQGPDFTCTGTILTHNTVLTAAHCVIDSEEDIPSLRIRVLGGKNGKLAERASYFTTAIYVHPKYNQLTYAHDLAVIVVRGSFDSTKTRSVQLASPNARLRGGQGVVASGFGRLGTNGSPPKRLQSLSARYRTTATCRRSLPASVLWLTYVKKVMCITGHPFPRVGGTGSSLCAGDSGGPLFLRTDNGRMRQYGVASFVLFRCGHRKHTSWFVDLRSYAGMLRQAKNGVFVKWNNIVSLPF